MKMKKIIALGLSILMALGLGACGAKEPSAAATLPSTAAAESVPTHSTESPSSVVPSLTIAVTKDENTLSPFTYVSATGLTVNRLLYDTLMTTDLNNEIVPWMVRDDYQIENNQVYTVHLLEGQKFHNGDPVDAEAVCFSFTYPADKNNSSQRKICNQIASVEALDDMTVRFTLKEPDVNFMRDGLAAMRIICPSVYKDIEDPAAIADSVGSGMYRLAEYKTGAYYILEAVPDYFKGAPQVQTLNMPIMGDSTAIQQALLAGELDASVGSIGMEMVDVFTANPNMKIFSNADFSPLIVNMNCGRAPFDQKDFRKAVCLAIDVNEICKTLYGDYALPGTPGLIRSDLPYAIESSYSYDPAQAVSLLEGLGYTELSPNGIRLDKNGDPLAPEIITYSGNAVRSRLCELMKEQLKAVGIDLQIVSLDMDTADAYIWPDFEVSKGRDYDMSTWGWGSSAGYTYLVSLCASDATVGNLNVCGYRSEAFDAIVNNTEISSAQDMETMLQKLQAVVADEIPLITIGFADKLQVCSIANYNGWQAGMGTNVVNIYSFLPEA